MYRTPKTPRTLLSLILACCFLLSSSFAFSRDVDDLEVFLWFTDIVEFNDASQESIDEINSALAGVTSPVITALLQAALIQVFNTKKGYQSYIDAQAGGLIDTVRANPAGTERYTIVAKDTSGNPALMRDSHVSTDVTGVTPSLDAALQRLTNASTTMFNNVEGSSELIYHPLYRIDTGSGTVVVCEDNVLGATLESAETEGRRVACCTSNKYVGTCTLSSDGLSGTCADLYNSCDHDFGIIACPPQCD